MILSKNQARIALFAAREPGRYAMHAVCLDRTDENEPKLIATDGRRLAVLPIELEPGDLEALEARDAVNVPGGEILLPVAPFRAACKGRKGSMRAVRLEWNPATLALEATVQECNPNGTSYGVNPVARFAEGEQDGEFPRWRVIVPETDSIRSGFGVNASFLEDAQAFLVEDGNPNAIAIGCQSPTSPLSVKGGLQGGAFAVVMPITMDNHPAIAADRQERIAEAETIALRYAADVRMGASPHHADVALKLAELLGAGPVLEPEAETEGAAA